MEGWQILHAHVVRRHSHKGREILANWRIDQMIAEESAEQYPSRQSRDANRPFNPRISIPEHIEMRVNSQSQDSNNREWHQLESHDPQCNQAHNENPNPPLTALQQATNDQTQYHSHGLFFENVAAQKKHGWAEQPKVIHAFLGFWSSPQQPCNPAHQQGHYHSEENVQRAHWVKGFAENPMMGGGDDHPMIFVRQTQLNALNADPRVVDLGGLFQVVPLVIKNNNRVF